MTAWVNSYWRNGPVLNNALSGVDMALWDIKGKLAGMPVHQLLGGKCRAGAAVYRHASGRSPEEVEARARRFLEEGVQYVRCQLGPYGGLGNRRALPEGSGYAASFDPEAYMRSVPRLFEHLRHGPGDVSPVGHAANVHLDIPCRNFGVQEWSGIPDVVTWTKGAPPRRLSGVSLSTLNAEGPRRLREHNVRVPQR